MSYICRVNMTETKKAEKMKIKVKLTDDLSIFYVKNAEVETVKALGFEMIEKVLDQPYFAFKTSYETSDELEKGFLEMDFEKIEEHDNLERQRIISELQQTFEVIL